MAGCLAVNEPRGSDPRGSHGLEELKLAASLASPVKGFAKLFVYWPSELGARLSPLTGRFPIRVRELAMAEALEIDRERVRLV